MKTSTLLAGTAGIVVLAGIGGVALIKGDPTIEELLKKTPTHDSTMIRVQTGWFEPHISSERSWYYVGDTFTMRGEIIDKTTQLIELLWDEKDEQEGVYDKFRTDWLADYSFEWKGEEGVVDPEYRGLSAPETAEFASSMYARGVFTCLSPGKGEIVFLASAWREIEDVGPYFRDADERDPREVSLEITCREPDASSVSSSSSESSEQSEPEMEAVEPTDDGQCYDYCPSILVCPNGCIFDEATGCHSCKLDAGGSCPDTYASDPAVCNGCPSPCDSMLVGETKCYRCEDFFR